jgi:ABC-type antimicrobial peptide transport system permease subunit
MSLAGAVRREVAALRPDLPVADLAPLTEITASSTARLRVVMWLLTIASAVAITLSGVGVYGVVAYLVNLRRRELGIRMVLGARGADLRSLVIRQGVAAALLGLVVGLIGAAFMSRIVAGMIFGVPSIDPSTLAAVVLILSVTAFVAALLPALRAARINPAVILRSDG